MIYKIKDRILREAARTHKAAENTKENGWYMSWQQLSNREKTLLEVNKWIDEIQGEISNDKTRNSRHSQ